jgi:hypothetical protein
MERFMDLRMGMRLFVACSLLVHVLLSATVTPEIKTTVTFIYPADAHGDIVRDAKTGVPTPCGTGFFVTVAMAGRIVI